VKQSSFKLARLTAASERNNSSLRLYNVVPTVVLFSVHLVITEYAKCRAQTWRCHSVRPNVEQDKGRFTAYCQQAFQST